MSIRLIVEVLDHWKDIGLTAGERNDLIVVAENANDQTRETFSPLHEEYILQRAGKSAAGWKNALGKLMGKKALEYAVRNGREMRGHPGQHAVYRIPELCPEPPHDGWHGYCTRPERVTSQMTHPDDDSPEMGHLSDDPLPDSGHPSGDPIGGMGHLTDVNGSPEGCEWVTSQVTPTPLSPQSPLLSLPQQLVRDANVVAEDERENFINWIKKTHKPQGPAWWRKVASNGDFTDLADAWRTQQTPAATSTLPPWCGHCGDRQPIAKKNPSLRLIEDDHGNRRPCPDCHPKNVRNTP